MCVCLCVCVWVHCACVCTRVCVLGGGRMPAVGHAFNYLQSADTSAPIPQYFNSPLPFLQHTQKHNFPLQALEQVGVVISRDTWLGYAEQAERTGMPATCRALVCTVSLLSALPLGAASPTTVPWS